MQIDYEYVSKQILANIEHAKIYANNFEIMHDLFRGEFFNVYISSSQLRQINENFCIDDLFSNNYFCDYPEFRVIIHKDISEEMHFNARVRIRNNVTLPAKLYCKYLEVDEYINIDWNNCYADTYIFFACKNILTTLYINNIILYNVQKLSIANINPSWINTIFPNLLILLSEPINNYFRSFEFIEKLNYCIYSDRDKTAINNNHEKFHLLEIPGEDFLARKNIQPEQISKIKIKQPQCKNSRYIYTSNKY
jgi:hypothetical protein